MKQQCADHDVLKDINFNGHFLINKSISIPKKVIDLYMSYLFIHGKEI